MSLPTCRFDADLDRFIQCCINIAAQHGEEENTDKAKNTKKAKRRAKKKQALMTDDIFFNYTKWCYLEECTRRYDSNISFGKALAKYLKQTGAWKQDMSSRKHVGIQVVYVPFNLNIRRS